MRTGLNQKILTLALLVLRGTAANDVHLVFPAKDFAVRTDWFYWRSDFQAKLRSKATRPRLFIEPFTRTRAKTPLRTHSRRIAAMTHLRWTYTAVAFNRTPPRCTEKTPPNSA